MELDVQSCQQKIQEKIKEVLLDLLDEPKEDYDLEKSFLDLGINSILSVELVENINRVLGIQLGIEVVFDYSGVKELGEFIFIQYGSILKDSLFKENIDFKAVNTNSDKYDNISETTNLKNKSRVQEAKHDIAIIGISGKFADSENLEKFWNHLEAGDNCIEEINRKGWTEEKYYDKDSSKINRSISKWGGLINNVERFDSLFFNISPSESERMDPQQRLFLEESYKAFEDSGYSDKELSGKRISVFVGARASDYKEMTFLDEINSHSFLGNDMSILASRIAYFLNLKGSSMAVDTACSSSLVSIHLACKSINTGESEMALAGGVFILSSPEFYIMASKTAMLSPEGKCKTFDNDADGIVVGEGVGALILKRADKAIEDGDHIYGIIKGTAVNQDGKTKGITAPSMLSQKALLIEAYNETSINPETISYIEAHGTGTKLGDPIEIKALSEAFHVFTDKTQFCAIGSHKPNFGHTITCAGIAGIFKILLAMKHKKIPATIGLNELNEHINFQDSPFFVNTSLREWKSKDGVPLRAGISSFGFSGTNCHIVIEEPPIQRNAAIKALDCPKFFALSAKTKIALQQKLYDIYDWLEKEGENYSFKDISYTLLIGRSHFSFRCAFIARNMNELKKLISEINRNGNLENYFSYSINNSIKADITLKNYGESILEEINENDNLIIDEYENKLKELCNLYLNGYDLEWKKLFNKEINNRIPLPTYPFGGENYWVKEKDNHISNNFLSERIHYLVHRNTSNLHEQKFSSRFTGSEFFLKDHVVNGEKVLPAAVYLEMVREALELSIDSLNNTIAKENKVGVCIRNIVWSRSIIVGSEGKDIHIGMYPEENEEVAYEIYSNDSDSYGRIVHSQGFASQLYFKEIINRDIEILKENFINGTISSQRCYEAFSEIGLNYGLSHQGIDKVYIGKDKILVKILLPSQVLNTRDEFSMHPSILDSALQSTLALMMCSDNNQKLALPFAIKKIEIYNKCSTTMWAVVKYCDNEKSGKSINKFDIELLDDKGDTCVIIEELSTKNIFENNNLDTPETLLMKPFWKEQPIISTDTKPDYTNHLVILCDPYRGYSLDIERNINGAECIELNIENKDIGSSFQICAVEIFEKLQEILKTVSNGKVLIQVVYLNKNEQQLFLGLSGLLKTAQLEISRMMTQIIGIDSWEDKESVIEKIRECSFNKGYGEILYKDEKRYVSSFQEIEVLKGDGDIPWKNNSTYLITGGLGELGLIFAREISQKVKNATLILLGRSNLSYEKELILEELRSTNCNVQYEQVDVGSKTSVYNLFDKIKDEHKSIGGILHCAGIIKDNFVINKKREEFLEVLIPKVLGLVNLDEASKSIPMDFFIVFSSIAGSFGNIGQIDYATANAFMDAFVKYRNELGEINQRSGNTISINWPLWKDGGMEITEGSAVMLKQNLGIVPIETSTGVSAFYRSLKIKENHVVVMEGNISKIREKFLTDKVAKETIAEVINNVEITNNSDIISKMKLALIQEVSKLLKVKTEDIDSYTELSDYGFDSITFTQFCNILNGEYKIDIAPTIFFEYSTIEAFVQYLVDEYMDVFSSYFITETKQTVTIKEEKVQEPQFTRRKRFTINESALTDESRLKDNSDELIAIVGVSGIFPMAADVEQFWANILEGKDCISEIPKERWDWKKYYGNPAHEKNKTNIKWGGFIDGVDEFDALFFGISPKEAELMDPQQRLIMTYIWKSIEDAGYSAKSLWGSKTGIFVGTTNSGYCGMFSKDKVEIEGYSSTGMVPSVGPNRMSYFLNFKGPSEPIETACSSSLVAIHKAVTAIKNGDCDMAIAGGVNTILNPDLYISFNKAGMLCEDGRCKTFSSEANGYVRGEGVGMILLKKLKDAEANGDHIYAVIKGTAENHGGRANSLTAPNPKAQAELLITAYTRAGVDPRNVTYIETHGSGTELGDPIEINGLKASFKELYMAKGYSDVVNTHCGLGSVKSNVGHLEIAAGMAGLIKVLFQLKHKTLVKSLRCNPLNPYIELKDSPFYIVEENKCWESLKDSNGNELPRVAGISSFGFGGANAHIVVEEYIPRKRGNSCITNPQNSKFIIPLSAKNEDRLKAKAKQLLEFINNKNVKEINLEEVAYTLQVGRDSMEERLALIVGSIEELSQKLTSFVNSEETVEAMFSGRRSRNKETLEILTVDEDMCTVIDSWVSKGKYISLAEIWAKGYNFDWNKMYSEYKPNRISLPTYPFAKETYWINKGKIESSEIDGLAKLNPLLHENISDFSQQRFKSVFTGKEFFFSDHIINGENMLPGAAYFEMYRSAVEKSSSIFKKGNVIICLKDLVWVKPIKVINEATEVNLRITLDESGYMRCEIFDDKQHDEDNLIYSQCIAELRTIEDIEYLDIDSLRHKCNEDMILSEECYEYFKSIGMDYGISQKGIEQIFIGHSQALAKLKLPFSIANTEDKFVLHPSLIDSALQAAMCLMTKDIENLKPLLPFAIEEVEIINKCTSSMWAFIEYSNDDMGRRNKIDIKICDVDGKVSVKLKGLISREILKESHETIMLESYWQESIPSQAKEEGSQNSFNQHIVITLDGDEEKIKHIALNKSNMRCFVLKSYEKSIDIRFKDYSTQLFEKIQSILNEKNNESVLIQLLINPYTQQSVYSCLSALLKTAELENPKIIAQVIEIETEEDASELIDKLNKNSQDPFEKYIKYKEGRRYVNRWDELSISQSEMINPWRDKGVYLMTGGLGSIGLIFAKEIAVKTKGTTLILTGRHYLSEEKKAKLEELTSMGISVVYEKVNVTNKDAIDILVQDIKKKFGELNGIIHCAGIIQDNFIIQKNKEEFLGVVAPKVLGLVNLDEASKDIPLDFFICFSSISSITGNIGQVDYATANSFMDFYAKYRDELVKEGKRKGKTLSINWPLWEEGGMKVSKSVQEVFVENIGMVHMKTSSGIRAFYEALKSGKSQVLVVEGDRNKICEVFFDRKSNYEKIEESLSDKEQAKNHIYSIEDRALKDRCIEYFKKFLASAIKLPVTRIEANVPMDKYGINSVMIIQLNNELEKSFGPLPKTIFFEYKNINELTEYFLKYHNEKLRKLVGVNEKLRIYNKLNKETSKYLETIKSVPFNKKGLEFSTSKLENNEVRNNQDIAIIGVSGHYPKSNNIHEFWDNLKNGVDCISEIPKERWDHSLYFDEDKGKSGKVYSKWGGFLDGIDQFDPLFFNISPREAVIIDPQERLFLECVYETIEDAGYTRASLGNSKFGLEGNVGVYVGVMYEEYQLFGAQEQAVGKQIALIGSPASIANRVSYYCNFHGPCMAIDTMCSSSLTAIHLAVQSIQRGECDVAIAGGVNVSLHPNKYILLSQSKFISSKGHCESFGKGGDGYVPGEGVGAVLLKPLANAIEDGDNIYGVIKATAINHGGRTNGYSVPNPNAQASVIKRVFEEARIEPRTISYIEAHGTGTSLGDPIEIAGLNNAFKEYTPDKGFCSIGSAKSNIGHCESAAGIAGVTKVLLQLKNKQIAPSLHSTTLNPNIDFINTPFVVQQSLQEWKRPIVNGKEVPRRAGISSFGAGGSNAYILIEEYQDKNKKDNTHMVTDETPAIIVISAKSEKQLKEQVQKLLEHISNNKISDKDLINMAYTLQVGREAMEERIVFIVECIDELEGKFRDFITGQDFIDNMYRGQTKQHKDTLFIFESDEDMDKILDVWIEKGKYSKLSKAWVGGLSVNWNNLYKRDVPCRISLPTYSFAKKSYWFTDVNKRDEVIKTNEGENNLYIKSSLKVSDDSTINSSFVKGNIAASEISAVNKIKLVPLSDKKFLKINQTNSTRYQIKLQSVGMPIKKVENKNVHQPIVDNKKEITISMIQNTLVEILAEILDMDICEVDIDNKFVDLGLDSITGVEWIQKIKKQYNMSIKVTKIYDYPSIKEFAIYLVKEFKVQENKNSDDISVETMSIPSFDKEIHKTENSVYKKERAYSNQLENELRSSLAKILYMDENDIDASYKFFDLGLDSITGVEWIQVINKQYGTSIKATSLYDYPCISEFSTFIGKQLEELNGTVKAKVEGIDTSYLLDDILKNVRQGTMDIEEAEILLKSLKLN
ncbi:SDR family NAD(P)-dependent oxidoreductase [Clostridium estertheticum]|uniref:SDR family NAD(P)-dependent oxidoreductase n=1 Tax=Clostridium estertheticum TaxID=238834 RepID=UPI001CF5EC8C|nr:SDR family NAD(P)-dependent oxidoreductase [Clostridium estertheticum]MCB2360141.1 SDR family NAD(P)-dependent oxidoreductase [Clostridium estertheticum]